MFSYVLKLLLGCNAKVSAILKSECVTTLEFLLLLEREWKKIMIPPEKSIIYFGIMHLQALTNQFLSNVCSRTPVLQYLFINVIPYQKICTCWWSTKCLTSFSIGAVFFWVSLSVLMVFLISAYCACNILEMVEST